MQKIYPKILLFTSVFMALIVLFKLLVQNPFFSDNATTTAYFAVMSGLKGSLFLLTLYLLRYEKISFSKFNKRKFLLLALCVLVFFQLYRKVASESAALHVSVDYLKLFCYSLHNLCIGLFEEFYFRLFVFSLLCRLYTNSLFKVTLLTSLLFAAVHASNLFLKSYSLSDVIFQVMFAFATGLLLQLVFINSKNIYIPVLLHFFIDFNSNFAGKFFNVSGQEVEETGFDFTTLSILGVFILLALVFTYFNLRKKENLYFQAVTVK